MAQGLPRKLRVAFILQAVMASFAIVIGFYLVGVVVEEILVAERVRQEADSYWAGRARNPAHPLPKTSTVDGYFVPAGASATTLPAALRPLEAGLHRSPNDRSKILVEEGEGGRLYLSMRFPLLDRTILWMGLGSALLALLAIYTVTWVTYRSSRRLVTPVNWLAGEVARWDPRDPNVSAIGPDKIPGGADSEVAQLGGALRGLAQRTREFVQRERDFTRDASHELRTPLTVIRVATDMLLSDVETTPRAKRSLQRIQRAGQDMEAVIDAFLILAREGDADPQYDEFDAAEVVYEEAEKARPLLAGKPVELEVFTHDTPRLYASPRVLSVMLGNLLSNACTFTERGRVEVHLHGDRIEVRDTGIGMSSEVLQRAYDPFWRADQFGAGGKGMGLSIVRRLGERFGWPVTLESAPGEGTIATVGFGAATR